MIEEKGYGKINLALRITERRHDGYHNIDTIFQSISLYDTIRLERAETFRITCSNPSLPCDETNLAYKAYDMLRPYCKGSDAVHIHIEKRIPLAAGLAGGSTDCAAVLRGLNRLWKLGLSYDDLCTLGSRLGADVPFCIRGGTARGTGIGEVLKSLPALPDWPVVIVHPHLAVHTGKAYSLFDEKTVTQAVDINAQEKAVRTGIIDRVIAALGNTFEELVIPGMPELEGLKAMLHGQGLRPLMSGSGPTLFAIIPPSLRHHDVVTTLTSRVEDADIFTCQLVTGV